MTHLSVWIIPHSGGGIEIHHFVIPIPRNPALLGQETSLHGVPAPEDTPKRTALSGNYDTPRKKKYGGLGISTLRGEAWESL